MTDKREKMRLLGLAFAGADLVFEIDDAGVITFVLGAVEQITGKSDADLVGQGWGKLFASSEEPTLRAALEALPPGKRNGPVRMALASGEGRRLQRFADLSLFRLPQNPPRVSCSLSIGGAGHGRPARDARGLVPANDFNAVAEASINQGELGPLDLIELKGLARVLSQLDPSAAGDLQQRLSSLLRLASRDGVGAVEVADEKFAMLGQSAVSLEELGDRLAAAAGPGVSSEHARLDFSTGEPQTALKAMRFALDRFLTAGPTVVAQGFAAVMSDTVRQVTEFRRTLDERSFKLVYQPIVAIGSDRLHHFEALARFDGESSPADSIRLAEELDLIIEFDMAVIDTVCDVLARAAKPVMIAANISAISLLQPAVRAHLQRAAHMGQKIRRGLLLEITETKAFSDLALASRAIGALRDMGFAVCIDDFGAGSASLDYLRHFEVDFVKIDGRFISQLGERRDAAVLRHVVALCADLGVKTIAEGVETKEVAEAARALGVDYGQGWHFGKPTATPEWTSASAASSGPLLARRRGEVEQWG